MINQINKIDTNGVFMNLTTTTSDQALMSVFLRRNNDFDVSKISAGIQPHRVIIKCSDAVFITPSKRGKVEFFMEGAETKERFLDDLAYLMSRSLVNHQTVFSVFTAVNWANVLSKAYGDMFHLRGIDLAKWSQRVWSEILDGMIKFSGNDYEQFMQRRWINLILQSWTVGDRDRYIYPYIEERWNLSAAEIIRELEVDVMIKSIDLIVTSVLHDSANFVTALYSYSNVGRETSSREALHGTSRTSTPKNNVGETRGRISNYIALLDQHLKKLSTSYFSTIDVTVVFSSALDLMTAIALNVTKVEKEYWHKNFDNYYRLFCIMDFLGLALDPTRIGASAWSEAAADQAVPTVVLSLIDSCKRIKLEHFSSLARPEVQNHLTPLGSPYLTRVYNSVDYDAEFLRVSLLPNRHVANFATLTELGPQPYDLLIEDKMPVVLPFLDSLNDHGFEVMDGVLSLYRSSLCQRDVYTDHWFDHPADLEQLRDLICNSDEMVIDHTLTEGRVMYRINNVNEWELVLRSRQLGLLLTNPNYKTIIDGSTLMTDSIDVLKHMASYQTSGQNVVNQVNLSPLVNELRSHSLNYVNDGTDQTSRMQPLFNDGRLESHAALISAITHHQPAYLDASTLELYNPNISFPVFYRMKTITFNVFTMLSASFGVNPAINYLRNPIMVAVLKAKVSNFTSSIQWLMNIDPNNRRLEQLLFSYVGVSSALKYWRSITSGYLKTPLSKQVNSFLPLVTDDSSLVEFMRFEIRSAFRLLLIPGLEDITQPLVTLLDNYFEQVDLETLKYYITHESNGGDFI